MTPRQGRHGHRLLLGSQSQRPEKVSKRLRLRIPFSEFTPPASSASLRRLSGTDILGIERELTMRIPYRQRPTRRPCARARTGSEVRTMRRQGFNLIGNAAHQNIRLGGIALFLRSQFQNDAARAADWQRAALCAHLGKKLEGKEVKASKANAL